MTRWLEFTKMHGAGNDFVVLDGIRDELPPLEPLAARLCDRHFGIGADQLLVVRPSRSADFRMQIFNADGSQVEMCANGIRAFFLYVREHGHSARGRDPRRDARRHRDAARRRPRPRDGRHGSARSSSPRRSRPRSAAGAGRCSRCLSTSPASA